MEKIWEITISIENIQKEFIEHLEQENNFSILFSWKLWIWKTYFLKKLPKESYDIYHLFPINYQINNNEDIINLIKYDILVEVLKKNSNVLEDLKIENLIDIYSLVNMFYNENKVDIIRNIASYIPKIWKSLWETFCLLQKFKEFSEDIKKWEKWIYENILKEIKNKNINEEDLISTLIKNKVSENKWNKKSILIFDDLDRIDPEHTFRLLNIFWAHFDNLGWNKFWFDKIIFVWDYNNLKSIFHHRYWEDTDFNWYINKFYTSEVFLFNNEKIIKEKIKEIIERFRCDESLKLFLKESWYISLFLQIVLSSAISLNSQYKLGLRELLCWKDNDMKQLKEKIIYMYDSKEYVIKKSINILFSIFWNDKNRFIKVLESSQSIKEKIDDYDVKLFNYFLYMLNYKIELSNNTTHKYKDFIFKIDWKYIKLEKDGIWKGDIWLFYLLLIEYVEDNF